MTDLSTPTHLRALVAALTEGERVQPWWSTTDGGDHWWVKAGGVSVANAGLGETAQRATEIIATVASPPVVLALADLLEALDHREAIADTDLPASEWLAVVQREKRARDALEAAIHRTGETG